MRTFNLFSTVFSICVFLVSVLHVSAQNLYVPNGVSGIDTTSNPSTGNIGVNTDSPGGTFVVEDTGDGDVSLRLIGNAPGIYSSATSELTIESSGYSSTSKLNVEDFSISQGFYPSCGTGTIDLSGNNASMTYYGGRISINGPSIPTCGPESYFGDDVVMGATGVSSLIVNNYGHASSNQGYAPLQSNYKFGVNGNGYVTRDFKVGNNMLIDSGKVAIGADSSVLAGNSSYNLYVTEGIRTEHLKVDLDSAWADSVFADDYRLKPLQDVETYIKEQKHLPGIPSEEEVSENGIDVAQMDARLLGKIEELTLYTIEQQETVKKQKSMLDKQQEALEHQEELMRKQQERIDNLESRLNKLQNSEK